MSKAVLTFQSDKSTGEEVGMLLEFFDEEDNKVIYDNTVVAHQLAACVNTVTLNRPEEMNSLLQQIYAARVDEE